MGGHGNFKDDRLGLDIRQDPDRVTPMLPALREYQFSIDPPTPPAGSYNAVAAARGKALFEGQARCEGCHTGPSFSDAPKLHAAAEIGMDPKEAARGATGMYRTTPLRGAWQHSSCFHDGSAATLLNVVEHYDQVLQLQLSAAQRADIAQYLLSLWRMAHKTAVRAALMTRVLRPHRTAAIGGQQASAADRRATVDTPRRIAAGARWFAGRDGSTRACAFRILRTSTPSYR